VFDGINSFDIFAHRPIIEGVKQGLTKYLGEHNDPQKWDFITHNGKVALLVPKRYFVLCMGKIDSIYLSFEDGIPLGEKK